MAKVNPMSLFSVYRIAGFKASSRRFINVSRGVNST
jgi:hypothetical protein